MQSCDLDVTLPDFDVPETLNPGLDGEGSGSCSFSPQSFDDFGLLDQTMDQALDFLSFAPMNMGAAGTRLPGVSNKLDVWNDFTFDVNALGGEFLSEPFNM